MPDGIPSLIALAESSRDTAAVEKVMVAGHDLAQIIYTIGTESKPKGALLNHDAVIWEYVTRLVDTRIEAGDVMLNALPLYHCAQLNVFLGPSIYVDGTNIITATSSPENIIAHIPLRGISSFFAPLVATVLQPQEQLPKAGQRASRRSTETLEFDDDRNDAAVSEAGEVVHRSPQLLSVYLNDPERVAASFKGDWFRSANLKQNRAPDGIVPHPQTQRTNNGRSHGHLRSQ